MARHHGRVAIVTGGGRGIGLAIAQRLAADGARVGCLDIDPAGAAGIEGLVPLTCDIANRAAVLNTIDAFVSAEGGLDVVVNNAVYFHYAPLAEMPPDMVDKMLDVGLKGTFWALQACTPHLKARGAGVVINLSSIAVSVAIRNAPVYTSIKAAIDGLTRQQAIELAPWNIRVNAVAPGSIPTPGANSVIDAEGWKRREAGQPLGRIIEAADIADTVAFLCSPGAHNISGVTLKIDGASTAKGP